MKSRVPRTLLRGRAEDRIRRQKFEKVGNQCYDRRGGSHTVVCLTARYLLVDQRLFAAVRRNIDVRRKFGGDCAQILSLGVFVAVRFQRLNDVRIGAILANGKLSA